MGTLHYLCLPVFPKAPHCSLFCPLLFRFFPKPFSLPTLPILQRQPDPVLRLRSKTHNRLMMS